MTNLLLLVDGAGQVSVAPLLIRTLREFPGEEGASIHFRPVRQDALFESAKLAGGLAHKILRGEGVIRSQLLVEFEVPAAQFAVAGRSSDLLFALALITARWTRANGAYPSIAATGELETEGASLSRESVISVRGVKHTVAKVAAAVAALASEQNSFVFYPKSDATIVDEWMESQSIPAHIRVQAVESLEHALNCLGINLEKVYLGNPFRGLQHFDFEHRATYFGRDREVLEVVEQLLRREAVATPGILVEGASGSGKSSLLCAGVLPALVYPAGSTAISVELRRRAVPVSMGRAVWRFGILPVGADEARIARAIADCWRRVPEFTQPPPRESTTLAELTDYHRNHWPDAYRFAWVLDQLEELFHLGIADPVINEFGHFLAALQAHGAWTLASIRADSVHELKRYQALREVFGANEGQYYLETVSATAVDDVISGPARVANLTYGSSPAGVRLDVLLREEAHRDRENTLPLLQFTLNELYLRRSGTELTFQAYQEMGGLSGSVATAAESTVMQSVTDDSRQVLALLFRHLVSVDETGRATRRYAPRSEFAADQNQLKLVANLVEARLCVTDLRDDEVVVAFAHEALLRAWPTLVDWLHQESGLLRTREIANRESLMWLESGKSAAWLAAGDKLATFRPLLSARIPFTELTHEFLQQSELRATRSSRIRRSVIAGIVALAVSTAVAGWFALRQRDAAVIEANTANRTTRFLVSLFQLADPTENRGKVVTVKEVLDQGVENLRGERGVNSLQGEQQVRAELLTAMGQAYSGLGLYPTALEVLKQARTDQTDQVPVESRVRTLVASGSALYLAGNYEEAGGILRRAVGLARSGLPSTDVLRSAALTGLADDLVQLEAYPEAERLCQEALQADRLRRPADPVVLAQTLDSIGSAYFHEGNLPAAESAMRESLLLRERALGMRHSLTAQSLNALASVLYQAGQFEQARSTFEQALPVYREVFGAEHPEMATILNNLGRISLITGHVDEAESLLRQALVMTEKFHGDAHDDLISPLNSLAMIDGYRGRMDEAIREVRKAETIARLPDQGELLDQVLLNEADLELTLEHRTHASQLLGEARSILEKVHPLDTGNAWRYAIWDSVQGRLLLADGDPTGESLMRSARATIEQRFGPRGFYSLLWQQRSQ